MAEMARQSRVYRKSDEASYGPEDDADNAPLQTPDFDNALRLTHHAQRLKALEIGMENFSRGMEAHARAEKKQFQKVTLLSIAIGGVCLMATLITGIVIGGAVSRMRAPAPQIAYAPQAVAAPAPVAQIAPPQTQNINAPSMAQLQPTYVAPAPVYQPQAQMEEPALEMPRPVAMGRYDTMLKETLKPARKITSLENAVTLRLSATNQPMPESWHAIFAREAANDPKAKLQIAAKFLKGEDVKADPAFALTLIRQAATSGNKEAMMWLAYSYDAGNLGRPDPASASKWFQEAAKAGVTGAYAELGRLYEKGVDGAPDNETALAWYQRAAQAGDTKAAESVQRLNRALLSQNVLLSAEPPVAKPPAPMLQPASVPAPTPRYETQRATPAAASIPAPNAEREADIRAAQRMLKVLGYKIEKADGALGPETQNAIRSYQRDHAAYPDGQFTPALLESLTRDIRFGQ